MGCFLSPNRQWTELGGRRTRLSGIRARVGRAFQVLLAVMLVASTGCNLLLPAAFVGDHRKKVLAEFDKLPNSRAVVLVWAPPATRFDYPHVQFEIGSHVTYLLGAKINEGDSHVDLVDPRDVADYLQRDPAAANSPQKVGRQFKADYVIFVELVRFQIRDPESPELLRPFVHAGVSVHDVRDPSTGSPRFELMEVKTEPYEGKPQLMTGTNELAVREDTYGLFSEQVARKFYDYTVEL